MLKNLWQYRGFIFNSVRNELVNRFVSSKLGGFWLIINPLAQVAIYALILSNVLATKLPGIDNKYAYAIYLMAGLLSWTLFSEIVGKCLNLFIENGNLMKKMSFPRITLPVIVLGSNILNNLLLFICMVAIFLVLGHAFKLVLFCLVPLTMLLAAFSLGIGLVLGVLNVFIRDVAQVVPISLQMLFWFTPIVYPESIIPEAFRHLLSANPLYHFVHAYHDVIVYGQLPPAGGLAVLGILSILLLTLALLLFRRSSEDMVDVL
ncbi:ABC transporter permease [Marivivens sp. JLT3646]|uniref:ABC transporter permease n=1 Tax=Marivivens sp. JLT3646 TaxID=1920883 RepID=UPI0008004155|nr:ABC transporter permease [Marivivens sp. JLT3646]APO88543.1 ABC transporter [Marivivens sp. JLT3646]OBR39265.1 ABC transporter [Donghicola sp. JL3646]